jgi:hypothetical protein
MKTLKNIGALLVCIVLTCCSKNDDDSDQGELQTYLTKITTSNSTTAYYYDENNRITLEEVTSTSSQVTLYRNFYNNNGQLIERTADYTDESFDYKYTYHYNAEGNLTKIETYIIEGGAAPSYHQKSEADYSVPGKISIYRTPYFGTFPYLQYEYSLDSKGNVLERLFYSPSQILENTTQYTTFDDEKSPEQLLPKTSYVQSFNNNLTYTFTDNTSGELSNLAFTYEYNNDGYPTKSTSNTGSIITYEYTKR